LLVVTGAGVVPVKRALISMDGMNADLGVALWAGRAETAASGQYHIRRLNFSALHGLR
jgi:hypothetical protein